MAARTGEGRAAILDAGYELIAELGYSGATTARICARAGVASGTFFHYFPTKLELLIGILEADVADSSRRAEALTSSAVTSAERALQAWLDALLVEAADPNLAGFVAGLGAAPADARLQALLSESASRQHQALVALMTEGQRQGVWRGDLGPDRLALWVGVIADGVLSRAIEDPSFDATGAAGELSELIRRYLAP